jgi:hypothetical protein
MGRYLETVFPGYVLLQSFDFVVLKFDDLTAPSANEMVVMFGLMYWFVA